MEVESLATRLCREVRELSLGTSGEIERIEGAPTSLRFLRDHVLPNKPCIITHAIDHWPALTAWTNSYLRDSLANQWVSVHSTPNGLADAVVDVSHNVSFADCTILPGSYNTSETERDHKAVASRLLDGALDHTYSVSNANPREERANTGKDNVGKQYDEKSSYVAPLAAMVTSQIAITGSPPNTEQMCYARDAKLTVTDHCKHGGDGNIGLQSLSSAGALSLYKNGDPFNIAAVNVWGIEPKEETQDCSWFVIAHVERVPFPVALDMILHSETGSVVAYAQEQNGCFLSEYSALSADAETHLSWATEALGCLPEAVNLWIGNEKAVTSFHKDHYENLYAVIAGEKHFTLLPPTDVDRLYIRQYPSACYVKHDGKFAIQRKQPRSLVPWASVDPYPAAELEIEAKTKFPKYFGGPMPFTCTLRAGEILYLPSLWFHHVRQSPDSEGRTIALNFWYDMQFDIKYAYYNFLETLILKPQGSEEEADG
ncbi:hypothetical protein L7F22_047810 [Adiantum nelumboides]|nr:hypothetical protein [Adiantum nelumboides]